MSHCISLFTEPNVGKARAGKLEEISGAIETADTFILSRLAQQQKGFPRWGLYTFTEQKLWLSRDDVMRMHIAVCDPSSYIARQSLFTSCGARKPD